MVGRDELWSHLAIRTWRRPSPLSRNGMSSHDDGGQRNALDIHLGPLSGLAGQKRPSRSRGTRNSSLPIRVTSPRL